MTFALNALAAMSLGAFIVACFIILALTIIAFWPECRSIKWRHIIRFLIGAAICGLVGGLVLQMSGTWPLP